jgi:hypothetical protein
MVTPVPSRGIWTSDLVQDGSSEIHGPPYPLPHEVAPDNRLPLRLECPFSLDHASTYHYALSDSRANNEIVGDFSVHLSLLFISSVFNQESDLGNLCSDGHVSKVLTVKLKTA